MRQILLGLLTMLVFLTVNGQESDGYRLQTSTAAEFAATLPDLADIPLPNYQVDRAANAHARVIRAVENEFFWRYSRDADFETLVTVFDKLKVPVSCMDFPCHNREPAIRYAQWFYLMVAAWFSENPVDLDAHDTLEFGDFIVYITRRDFNADGQHEWLLDVHKGRDTSEAARYVTVADTPAGYRIAPVPLQGTTTQRAKRITDEPITEVYFEDINADGLPEWVLRWSVSWGAAAEFYSTARAVVLGWNVDHLVTLGYFSPFGRFENIDNDPALEMVTSSQYHGDFWYCGYREYEIFDWNGTHYVSLPYRSDLDCTARHAEDAMWAWDFETAITRYDTYFATENPSYVAFNQCLVDQEKYNSNCEPDRSTLIYYYFQVRRILAHALLGHQDRVVTLLDALREEPYKTRFAQAMLDAASTDAQTLCRTAYNYYVEHPRISENLGFYPGSDGEDFGIFHVVEFGWLVDPYRAGCDIRLFTPEPTPTPVPTRTPLPTATPSPPDLRSQEQIWLDEKDFWGAWSNADYASALHITDTVVAEDDFETGEWRYYRALALEASARADEALAAYMSIHEAAPTSIWGQLAMMHLDREEPDGGVADS